MARKRSMSSFDILAETRELSQLQGSWFQKAYSPTPDSLLVRLRKQGGEKASLLMQNGRFILDTSDEIAIPDSPGHLATMLRKHISNIPLEKIEQHGFDRVVVLSFGREMSVQVVLELFGKGNTLLLKDGRILGLQRSEVWKDRTLKPGTDYVFPSSRADPTSIDIGGLKTALEGGHDLVRALALGLNLGGTYAEEVCLLSGIDKSTAPAELSPGDVESVYDGIRGIMTALDSPRPNVVISDGEMVDVLPIVLRRYEDMELEFTDDFNSALDRYFDLEVREEVTVGAVRDDRTVRIMERQRMSLEQFRKRADEAQAMGDLIYEHYQVFDGALKRVNELISDTDWGVMNGSLPDGIRAKDRFGSIEVKVPGTETWVPLDIHKDINANSAGFYDEAKKLRSKADGAEVAIERKAAERRSGVKRRVRRRSFKVDFWWERYRWCHTTGGHLVMGGRDRKTNELLVRKHLKDGDIYVHADIHGAPSCVMQGGAEADDEDRRQACAFAAIYSKAWNSGLGSVPAYWVTPDQVSRTPESGEYLPRGAFIVRGKRNHYHHLPMELCIGNVEVEGKVKLMGGPRECVEAMTKTFIVLAPGDTKKEHVKELADSLSTSTEEVMRVLPGPYRIVSREG